jgi:hypothetical protein
MNSDEKIQAAVTTCRRLVVNPADMVGPVLFLLKPGGSGHQRENPLDMQPG